MSELNCPWKYRVLSAFTHVHTCTSCPGESLKNLITHREKTARYESQCIHMLSLLHLDIPYTFTFRFPSKTPNPITPNPTFLIKQLFAACRILPSWRSRYPSLGMPMECSPWNISTTTLRHRDWYGCLQRGIGLPRYYPDILHNSYESISI